MAREEAGERRVVAVGDTAHASVGNALRLLGLDDVIEVPTGPSGRLTGDALRAALQTDPTRAKRLGIVIAAGARPVVPDIPGLAEVGYVTSDDIMRVDEVPPRLAILGGGFISCEMAHVFDAFGSRITSVLDRKSVV